MKIIDPSSKLIWITPNCEKVIEEAARICYKSTSEEKVNEDFLISLWKNKHHSVFEHSCASFVLVVDRGISHELVRHRLASYSQESTRFCNYSKDRFGNEISVIVPAYFLGREDKKEFKIWKECMENCEKSYLNLLCSNVKPQFARSVLPTCLKTEIQITANFREWLHILKLRLGKNAHPDMRFIMTKIKEILEEKSPLIFNKILRMELDSDENN